MLCEAQGHPDLFAIGDSTVKTPTVAQDSVDLFVVFGSGGLRQFPAHDVGGQVGQQFEVGHFHLARAGWTH
jgi:hypothetical protein